MFGCGASMSKALPCGSPYFCFAWVRWHVAAHGAFDLSIFSAFWKHKNVAAQGLLIAM